MTHMTSFSPSHRRLWLDRTPRIIWFILFFQQMTRMMPEEITVTGKVRVSKVGVPRFTYAYLSRVPRINNGKHGQESSRPPPASIKTCTSFRMLGLARQRWGRMRREGNSSLWTQGLGAPMVTKRRLPLQV